MKQIEEPFDGIPPWARDAVVRFLDPFFENAGLQMAGYYGWHDASRDFLLELQNNLRIPIRAAGGLAAARQELLTAAYADNGLFMRILEFALERPFFGYDDDVVYGPVENLNRTLEESGSLWTVVADGHGAYRLERRVSPETQSAMQQAQEPSGNASDHLRDAWAAAYGRNPNASEAYRHAVKAVEALAVQLAEPNNANATLGSAIGALRGDRAPFASILANSARRIGSPTAIELTGCDTMLAQMDLLWHNQTDRHSPGDTHQVVPITQEQAEWAVHTAIYLVEVLRRGWLHRF